MIHTTAKDEIYLKARVGRSTHITASFTGPVSKREIRKAIAMLDIIADGLPDYVSAHEANQASTEDEVYLEVTMPTGPGETS